MAVYFSIMFLSVHFESYINIIVIATTPHANKGEVHPITLVCSMEDVAQQDIGTYQRLVVESTDFPPIVTRLNMREGTIFGNMINHD